MATAAKPKSVSRRPSRPKVDSANHTSSSEITSSAAFTAASEPYYSLDTSLDGSHSKKRKVERACDFCRRRKTKCDGPSRQDSRCTNCIQNGRDCTYVEVSKPRGPPKAYIQALEDRIERMELLLKRLRPEADFTQEIGHPIPRDSWKSESHTAQPTPRQTASSSHSQSNSLVPPQPSLTVSGGLGISHATAYSGSGPVMIALAHATSNDSIRSPHDSPDEDEPSSASSSDNEDYGELSLVRSMQNLSLKPLESHDDRTVPDSQWRFHGKSSSFKLINTARKLQSEAFKASGDMPQESATSQIGAHRRPYFWIAPEYESTLLSCDVSTRELFGKRFPPPDLAQSLADEYFNVMNAHFPLLHRPTFDKQLNDRLYDRDIWFSCLCMSVFGVGARWSKDPRVLWDDDKLLDEVPDSTSPMWGSAGWKYIQVALEILRTNDQVILPSCLFELQSYHLLGLFLRSTSFYSDAWKVVSLGLRKAQDVGAHRRKVYGRTRTAEDELWKRAYWCLMTFDHLGSMINGRPCASRDEDTDLDMPLQVDDEYWEDEYGNPIFRQPPDKPCRNAFFSCWLKLTQIAAFALRTLYAIGKSKIPLGLVGTRWREDTLSRLNEALTTWVQEVPDHLKWSPTLKDQLFASQATTLVTTYYMVTIVIHRPFIPMPYATQSLGGFQAQQRHSLVDRPDFPWTCLAICTNAAKATAAIWETNDKLHRLVNLTSLANSCYISAGVLLVHIWLVRAMEKAEGPNISEERKQSFKERMIDLMDHLQKLMARLEGIGSGFEIAREWLKEIKESLPPEDTSPQQASAPSYANTYSSTSHGSHSSKDTEYNFSSPSSFTNSVFLPSVPPTSSSPNASYSAGEDEFAYTFPATNSLVASAPIPHDYGSTLANTLYPFNPAQSWESSRAPDSSQVHQFNQTFQPTSRLEMRRASLAPAVSVSQAEDIPPLRHYRSSSDVRSFPGMIAPRETYSRPVTVQKGQAARYGDVPQPSYPPYVEGSLPVDMRRRPSLRREYSNSQLRNQFGQSPMAMTGSPLVQTHSRVSSSPGLHTSRSQGSLRQAWSGNLPQGSGVYHGDGSWREHASHAGHSSRNSSFSSDSVSHMVPGGIPGYATPPEQQSLLRRASLGYGTLYTPSEGNQPQDFAAYRRGSQPY